MSQTGLSSPILSLRRLSGPHVDPPQDVPDLLTPPLLFCRSCKPWLPAPDLLLLLSFPSVLSIHLTTFLFPVWCFFSFYPLICSLSASIAPAPPLRNPILFSCCCFGAFLSLCFLDSSTNQIVTVRSVVVAATTTTTEESFCFSARRLKNTKHSF